jgi:hypothetical protein
MSKMPLRAGPGWSCAIVAAVLLAGCARTGDFGRVKPSPFHAENVPIISASPFDDPDAISPTVWTDDERELRDRAYTLLEPAGGRVTFDEVLLDFRAGRRPPINWAARPHGQYVERLMTTPFRSSTARYERLISDIRNDMQLMGPFFETASRVADMDLRRKQSLSLVSNLTPDEKEMALNRIAENAAMVEWVCGCLIAHERSYRFALERLVITLPAPVAAEAERVLNAFTRKLEAGCGGPLPGFEGGAGGIGPGGERGLVVKG